MKEIRPILEQMEAADEVKKMALGIFGIIADAEAKAHGIPVEEVHFHEVGAVDSLIDIVGVSYCCWSLGITEAYVSPLSERSVSYTHLDVYKRQGIRILMWSRSARTRQRWLPG